MKKINYNNVLNEKLFILMLFTLLMGGVFFINSGYQGIDLAPIVTAWSIALLSFIMLFVAFLSQFNIVSKKWLYIMFYPPFPYRTVKRIIKNESKQDFDAFKTQMFLSKIRYAIMYLAILIVSSVSIKTNIYNVVIIVTCSVVLFNEVVQFILTLCWKNGKDVKILEKLYIVGKTYNSKSKKVNDEVIEFIEQNKGIANYKEIGKKFDISNETLNKIVQSESGFTFKQYSLNLKMKYAKKLLEENKYSTQEIAEMCGYNSKSSFLKAYKAHNN
ncbi:hypothetical protein SCHIN_v1c01840 [Spiroplasma chinense]|uniref:HTH araC/xylS-type domain-containing protein n=1 Tax=Spiroplasma chinense TaxID=216932 RepID=A0A5B9Y5T0_9MOLU|nr:helix-turn-helix domain-containing protein [Spiroplasma chinense]QEH61382.1 hypothetical protein SCHIN_v1c01840 [Spiroplasma chinense]